MVYIFSLFIIFIVAVQSSTVVYNVGLEPISPNNPNYPKANGDYVYTLNGTQAFLVKAYFDSSVKFISQMHQCDPMYISKTPEGAGSSIYSAGVSGNPGNFMCSENTTLILTPTSSTPTSLYYSSIIYSFTGGRILVAPGPWDFLVELFDKTPINPYWNNGNHRL
jgi:hypothetical protein